MKVKKDKKNKAKESVVIPPVNQAKKIPLVHRKILEMFNEETAFIEDVFKFYHTNKEDEHLDEYLIELSEGEEEEKRKQFFNNTKKIMEGSKEDENNNNNDSEEDDDQIKKSKKLTKKPESTPHRAQLLEKLHAKIATVAQAKRKKDKKQKKLERFQKKNALKKFTSKTNPNLKSNIKSVSSTPGKTVVVENGGEKTPLQKKEIKKSNGEVVYSKFDFISEEKRGGEGRKIKATHLLKEAEKRESKIKRLEERGRESEAVALSESQKWITALKRAEGQKVKDDPGLLRKTIRKEKKIKEHSKKKWGERLERVEKQKKERISKRETNIKERKDDRKKKNKKLQRKRGRIL